MTHCIIGNLLDNSLSPEAKNLGHEVSLDKGVLDEGGANSFSLGHKQHKPTKNKTAIGQQTALPRAKPQKQKGQQKAVSKLRTQQKTRFTEKIQLALLDPEDPRSILDEQASKDLSLRILLTLSLMKKWPRHCRICTGPKWSKRPFGSKLPYIPNWILAFARPTWTEMVHFGLKRSILVHLGPPTYSGHS